MKTTAMLIAGAMLSLATFGATVDSITEERYRAKYGRYTPAEGIGEKAAVTREAPRCCRDMNPSFSNSRTALAFQEAFFHAKYGRPAPAVEVRERVAAAKMAKHVRACIDLRQCTLMPASPRPLLASAQPTAGSLRETFLQLKYGWSFPEKTSRESAVSASLACEHACCERLD